MESGSFVTARFTITVMARTTTIMTELYAPKEIVFFEIEYLLFWMICVVRNRKRKITVAI